MSIRYTITIPMNYNDETPVPEWVIEGFLETALAIGGGATFGPVAEGLWRSPDDGTVYREPVRVLEIIAGWDDESKVRALALRIKLDLKQDGVLLTSDPIRKELV